MDISVDAPDGMEEEEVISILDEVLRDPEIAEQINDRLADSGLSLSVLEVEAYEEDEDEDDEFAEPDEDELGETDEGGEIEVVEPVGDEEGCSKF